MSRYHERKKSRARSFFFLNISYSGTKETWRVWEGKRSLHDGHKQCRSCLVSRCWWKYRESAQERSQVSDWREMVEKSIYRFRILDISLLCWHFPFFKCSESGCGGRACQGSGTNTPWEIDDAVLFYCILHFFDWWHFNEHCPSTALGKLFLTL